VAQKNECVSEMIANVVMLTRLDKNVSKIPFLDVNVSNFLLDENVNIFLLEENISNFFNLISVCFYCTNFKGKI